MRPTPQRKLVLGAVAALFVATLAIVGAAYRVATFDPGCPSCPMRKPCPKCPPCDPVVLKPGPNEPTPEPEPEPPEPECVHKTRLVNAGNRDHCVEVAEAPPKTSDDVMRSVGNEADVMLRRRVAWIRHGLGTRAKDRKRVVRYYNVTRDIARAVCPFLDCSEAWIGVTDKQQPEVVRTCRVMRGTACDY